MPHAAPAGRAAGSAALFAGLVLVSTAGPFLHLADIDAYAVAVLRMALGAALLLGFAAARGQLAAPRELWPQLVLGALLFAAHLVLWVKAFDLTDYASNLLLLVSQPVVAAALGAFLGERPTRDTFVALGLSLAGLGLIARGDLALGPRALLGDALCVLASVAITLFVVVTRRARAALPLPTFLGAIFALGAVAALPVALLAGDRLSGYPPASWGWLAALVLLTTVGGHGLMNVAARHVKLFTLNVVIVLEPPIGIALGALLFDAQVTGLQLGGGALLGVAVFFGLRTERNL